MNTLTKHIPAFAYNGEEIPSWDFETVDDLMNLEWVKGWGLTNSFETHFICQSTGDLMIVKNDESWWWVLGHLKAPVDGLMEWYPGKKSKP